MKVLILIAALAIATCSFAQKRDRPPIKMGVISAAELSMDTYALDTAADAVVLFDVGTVSIGSNLEATFIRHTRIKFLGTKEIARYSSRTIYHEADYQSVIGLKATTYNLENGRMVESKLESEGIFREKVNKYIRAVKFTMPNVKPGSVVEYTYTIKSEGGLIPRWEFQQTIPTVYSEFETMVPGTVSFRKDMQGFLPLTNMISSKDGSIQTMIMKDVPAFKVEPFITTEDDFVSAVYYYISGVHIPGYIFKIPRTWPEISEYYNNARDFGVMILANGWLDKTVDPLVESASTEAEKAKRIHDYIKANITFTKLVDRYPDHPLKKVFEDKKGSSSEINMLMISMMRRAGLDAHAVLISTRDHGLIRMFNPNAGQFNDVLCLVRIGGKDHLLDGTDKTLSYDMLPERCLNGEGLLVSEKASAWIPIVPNKSKAMYDADLKINSEGQISGRLSILRDGLFAGEMRASYASLGKQKYLSEEFANKTWDFNNSEFKNYDGIDEAAVEVHDVIIRDHAQTNGNIIYINPYVDALERNDFISPERKCPVFMPSPFERTYTAKFEIPQGYKVEEMPPNKMLRLPENAGRFVYSITMIGNTINFTSQLTITNNVINPDKYAVLREFYSQVVAKQAEQIVLKAQ